MRLTLVGLSHHVAPVALRERVTLDLAAAAAVAREAGDAVCLSTCNRTELYLADGDDDRVASMLEGSPVSRSTTSCTAARRSGRAAPLPGRGRPRLARPGRGRDSRARCARRSSPVRRGRCSTGCSARRWPSGKRVRTETAIGRSPASVSSAAAALAAQVFGDLTGRRVLLIGAGRIGELAAANLASRGARIAYVANRTLKPDAAWPTASTARRSRLADVPVHLAEIDVVVSSTSSATQVLRAEDVPARRGRPAFLIDIAVPRTSTRRSPRSTAASCYDIDDLEAVVAETLAGRRAEAERAEQLVGEEGARFRRWQASLDVVPAIASLRARAEEIRRAEPRSRGAPVGARAPPLDSVTTRILNKLLHLPTVRMKEAAVTAEGAAYAEAVRHLFGLEEER